MIAITVSIVVISISVHSDRLSGHELVLAIRGSSQVVSISVLKRPDIPLPYSASVTYRLVASLVLINKNILNSNISFELKGPNPGLVVPIERSSHR